MMRADASVEQFAIHENLRGPRSVNVHRRIIPSGEDRRCGNERT